MHTLSPSAQSTQERIHLSKIDESMRLPGLIFLAFSLFWLMVGTVFALISSLKLHHPDMLTQHAWLTFGRTRSAHLNAVSYGWLNNAVYAVCLWIMARLCQRELMHKGLLIAAAIFWNIGVTVGIIGLLAGQLTSVEWLEMPRYVAPLLALSYAMIGAWGLMSFRYRQSSHVYVSQWYILAASLWFPWLYTVVQIMLFWLPAQGTVQAITNWWFGHNVLGLWYTPMSLAAAYYFIPKVLGKPIHSYYLSVLGFWTLALFYNWAGVHHLIGGPIPIWLVSIGTVASVMMVIPVVTTAINHHLTCVGCFRQIWQSPTLRFVVFGSLSYTLTSFAGSAMALRDINVVTHFTHFTVGHAHHGAYAFVTMILFGSIYFMLPRLLQREWPSARLIRIHFWCCALGITWMVVALHIGGWIQGLEMNDASIPFIQVVEHTKKWLAMRSASGLLIAVGHVAFCMHFCWMLLYRPKQQLQGPTLFTREPVPVN
jgi:cytochrome c oxidase cbb3-type subunit 1